LQKGTFTFGGFLGPPIAIVPAMSVVVIVVIVEGWFLLLPEDDVSPGRSAILLAAVVANIYFLAKYQRLFRQWGGNASAPCLVFGR
jgi:hypothetical protein